MEQNGYCKNPFDEATTVITGTQLTHNASYNDV
ncbi:hypothetical protein DEU39_2362 [Chryseobacterium sp. AG363]|nr:hypothetical protein DEU39_2362 [Chryseobacterium sp. AG363]